MWRHQLRRLSQVVQKQANLKAPPERLPFSKRFAWISSTGLIIGSSWLLYEYYQGNYDTLKVQNQQEQIYQLIKKPEPAPLTPPTEVTQEIIAKTVEAVEQAQQEVQQPQKVDFEEKPKEIQQEQQVQVPEPKKEEKKPLQLDKEHLNEWEKSHWQKLSTLADQIIQKSQEEKHQEQLNEPASPLPKENQTELSQYFQTYEEHLKYLQKRLALLQKNYEGSNNTVQKMQELLPTLHEQIKEKDKQIVQHQKDLKFSLMTFNLLIKLQNDFGDISNDLKECSKIQDKKIQEAYKSYITNNYQYLTEQGIPSKVKILQMFHSLKQNALMAHIKSKSASTAMIDEKATLLVYKLTPSQKQEEDVKKNTEALTKVEQYIEDFKFTLALQEIEKLHKTSKNELVGLVNAIRVRLSVEAFVNVLSSQIKLINLLQE